MSVVFVINNVKLTFANAIEPPDEVINNYCKL